MKSNANILRRDPRNLPDQLLPGLLPLDHLLLVLPPHPAAPPAIHAPLLLPNASVFTPSARTLLPFPAQIS